MYTSYGVLIGENFTPADVCFMTLRKHNWGAHPSAGVLCADFGRK